MDATKLRILHSNVLYRRLPPESKVTKDSLIILPGGDQAALSADGLLYGGGTQRYGNVVCEVIDVGPGEWKDGERQKMGNLKKGDLIVLDQQSGRTIENDICYCHISEIIGIIKGYN